jgi:hypothetical protein
MLWNISFAPGHCLPYKTGNRHERRKLVARARGAYMRDKRKEAEFEKDFRKDAIADRVERRQNASHQRALARKAASKNSR